MKANTVCSSRAINPLCRVIQYTFGSAKVLAGFDDVHVHRKWCHKVCKISHKGSKATCIAPLCSLKHFFAGIVLIQDEACSLQQCRHWAWMHSCSKVFRPMRAKLRGGLPDWLIKQGLTSHQTHYRSYRGRFLQVIWPNQQCQSTEGNQCWCFR